MKIPLFVILRNLFLFGLGLILVVLVFSGQDTGKLLSDLKNANYFWVAASALACLGAHIVRAMRWQMMIRPMGYKPSVSAAFGAIMVGYLANLALPRMGEIVRCGMLGKNARIPADKLVGTVIIERLIDLLTLIAITVITLAVQSGVISQFLYDNVILKAGRSWPANSGIIIFLVLVTGLIVFYYLMRALLKRSARVKKVWIGLMTGLRSARSLENKPVFILQTIMIWALYYLAGYLCLFALPATASLGLNEGLTVLVFGSLGMVAPVQGGIGAYHWMVSEGLTLFDIAQADGLAFATIIHSSQTLMVIFVGILCMIPSFTKKNPADEQVAAHTKQDH